MVKLAIANSRMKDFYDLQVIATTFDFESDLLLNAISGVADINAGFPLRKPAHNHTSKGHNNAGIALEVGIDK